MSNLNDLLKPIRSVTENNFKSSNNIYKTSQKTESNEEPKLDKKEREILFYAKENLTDAVRGMVIIVRDPSNFLNIFLTNLVLVNQLE